MKAITLHQPWASLVAEGVKTIETRSWSTKYRGPLVIHAGLQRHKLFHLPPLWSVGSTRAEQEQANYETFLFMNAITAPEHQRPHRMDIRDRVPKWATSPTLMWPAEGPHARPKTEAGHHYSEYLPLGAVVATCELVDVVPMVDFRTERQDTRKRIEWIDDTLWLRVPREVPAQNISGQLPFGDFRPGRHAWILDNVRKAAPMPCKGHQGLWNVPPEIADELLVVAA